MHNAFALIIVDVQNDFCPGGSLAVPDGDAVVPVLNRYIDLFHRLGAPVFSSRDWHPAVTAHFRDFGGIWPVHCVQHSAGARFHGGLQLPAEAIVLSKGMDPNRDDYSAFQAMTEQGEPLPAALEKRGITRIYVGGLATDYCVKETVLEGLHYGLSVTLLEDAVRGVDLAPGDSNKAIEQMVAAGAARATYAQIESNLAP